MRSALEPQREKDEGRRTKWERVRKKVLGAEISNLDCMVASLSSFQNSPVPSLSSALTDLV